MKKTRLFAATLALCLLCCSAFSMTAFAAENQTSATTSVLYTVQGGYTVNIPASVNLNSEEIMEITATELTIPSGKDLVVRLDDSCLNESDMFVMRTTNGASLSFDICVSHLNVEEKQGDNWAGSSFLRKSSDGRGTVVARFGKISQEKFGEYIPTEWGRIDFSAEKQATVSGEYSGSLNFIIGLENSVG